MPYRVASLKTSMRQCQVHNFGHTLCVLCRPSGLFHGHRGQHLTSSTKVRGCNYLWLIVNIMLAPSALLCSLCVFLRTGVCVCVSVHMCVCVCLCML